MKKLITSLVRRAFCLLFLALPLLLQAQTDKLLVDLADEMYEFGDFEDALGIYLQAIDENPNNVRAHLQIGNCYLKTTSRKKNAIKYFKSAYDLDPEISNKIFFLIGEGYRFGYEFDRAVDFYDLFLEQLETNRRLFIGDDVDALVKRTQRRIFECQNAKEYTQNPKKLTIVNLGSKVNSEYEDYAPSISTDQQTLIFTSKRAGSTGGFKDHDNKFFEDIWMSTFTGDEWSAPVNMGEEINSDEHESNLGLNPDGNILYIYKDENGGDIYFSEKSKGAWSKPKPLGKTINTEYRETSVSVSADGQKLFFTSNRPGGKGSDDIYVAETDGKGGWKNAELLSEIINTPYSEESPIFDVNSNTLYFSSKGHKGMGGFDLYKSEQNPETGEWSEPVNLGYPINSADDDLYFTLAQDGKTAYFSSFKEDSEGGNDIYMIYPVDSEDIDSIADVIIPRSDTSELAGRDAANNEPVSYSLSVIDADTKAAVPVMMKLYDKDNNEELFSSYLDLGLYTHDFRDAEDTEYMITLEADGYQFQTIKLKVPAMGSEPQALSKSVVMRRPRVKSINNLRNVYFSFDEFTLRPESSRELDLLEKMMRELPEMTIEIAGHTDDIGSEEYNKALSMKRANSVRDYLVGKGIGSDRVQARGYGKTKPLASNDDEDEGRELNRRTEFIILKK